MISKRKRLAYCLLGFFQIIAWGVFLIIATPLIICLTGLIGVCEFTEGTYSSDSVTEIYEFNK